LNSRVLKPVVQQERTGCGIASVAAVAGLSYPAMKAIAGSLGIRASDRQLWSQTGHVRRLLRHLGFKPGRNELAFQSWEALPDLALLSIKWHREHGTPYWHWVVFVRERGTICVLDSKRGLSSNRRTDFGRMKPKWYITVTRA